MKRSLLFQLFFWCFLIILSIPANAQYSNVHKSRVPKQLLKKTKGSFVHKSIKSVQQGDIAYGYEDISGNIFSVPIPAGTPLTDLAPWTPPDFATCGVRGGDGNYYVVSSGASSALWLLDPNTGTITMLGSITGLEAGATIQGIAYDAFNNSYCICGGIFGTNSDLYELDINTLTVTLIGTFPDPAGSIIGIAINLSGIGYAYDIVEDSLYVFNPVTGTASSLFPLGLNVNPYGDMDIDQSTGTIYLAAFNNATMTDQLNTIDPNTGNKTLIADWGFDEVSVFAINNDYGPPVGPGPATNPDPANGATGVALNAQLSWTNPAGATSIQVFFGTNPNNLNSIYSGTPVTSVDPGTLSSSTTYYWRVDETDGTGTTTGSVWNFTTTQVLPPGVLIDDHFSDLSNWTIVGPMGFSNWILTNDEGDPPPALEFNWTPEFNGDSWIMDTILISGYSGEQMTLSFYQNENWYTDPYDLEIGITTDSGNTWNIIWDHPSNGGSNGPGYDTVYFNAVDNMRIGFGFSGNSFNINYWAIDNVILMAPLPVEMTSFTADANQGNVNLNWSTASETNNKGFEIQRSSNKTDWLKIGFKDGYGTTAQKHNYTYSDNVSSLKSNKLYYRLKQVDFNGSYKYSDVVEVSITNPTKFSLEQNYPNPFNPNTKIEFSIPHRANVKLEVYNSLGQRVAVLINRNMESGKHLINFNAENLPSGIYYYRLSSDNFSQTKKLILLK